MNKLRQLRQHSLELAPTAKPAARHAKIDSRALAKLASTGHPGCESARTCTSDDSSELTSEWSTDAHRPSQAAALSVVASSVPRADAPPVRVPVPDLDEEEDADANAIATDNRTMEDLRRRLAALKSEPLVPLL